MAKKLMICPICDDSRAFTWAGCLLHVKAKHPNKLQEIKDNKELYMTKFACDEFGNPTEPQEPQEPPEPEPKPDPEPEPPEPKPEPKTKPKAPEVKPPEKKPEPKKPAESGGFLDELTSGIFGD